MLVKVKDNDGLVRDMRNNSILNTNPSALKKHEMIMKEKENAKQLADDVTKMKSEMSDIKQMLQLLIDREK
jgi:hypothetical protein